MMMAAAGCSADGQWWMNLPIKRRLRVELSANIRENGERDDRKDGVPSHSHILIGQGVDQRGDSLGAEGVQPIEDLLAMLLHGIPGPIRTDSRMGLHGNAAHPLNDSGSCLLRMDRDAQQDGEKGDELNEHVP